MRVTVTRPEHSGLKTAARLQALGHEPILLPLSKPIHQPLLIEAALREPFTSLAITSAEALLALEQSTFEANLITKPLLVVGEPSAKAAKDFGFENILTANGFATGMISLLEHLPAAERHALSPMLYLAGNPRGETFERGLSTLGIEYRSVDAYRMEKCRYSAEQVDALLSKGRPDAVLFFSSEAVRDYFGLLNGHVPLSYFNDTKFFCISEKVAAQLPNNLSSQSIISKDTSEQGIIDLLAIISGT